MIHRVWQILTSLQRLITLDTKVQLQHGRYHLKDMTHIFLPIKRNKLITPFFIYISMVFCRPSTFCCIPGQLHILIIFYIVCSCQSSPPWFHFSCQNISMLENQPPAYITGLINEHCLLILGLNKRGSSVPCRCLARCCSSKNRIRNQNKIRNL